MAKENYSYQVGPQSQLPGRGQLSPCHSAGWKGLLRAVYPPFLSEEGLPGWSGIELLGRETKIAGCAQLYQEFHTKNKYVLIRL